MAYTTPTNTMNARDVPDIVRTSNSAGRNYFMSLHSGKRIHSYQWGELPIGNYVIERVEELAEIEKQPLMHNGIPSFEWAPGMEITDGLA